MVPLFPLAARLRCEPDLHHEAVAILEGSGNTARVVAASRRARRAGVRPGMTLTQARARCPRLIARARDPESEGAAREVLLEIAESFSPRIEEPRPEHEEFAGGDGSVDGAGIVYLDLDGLERHHGSRSPDDPSAPERALGTALMRRLDDAGLPARVGIASSKLAARVAAGLARVAAPPPDEPGVRVDAERAAARIEPSIVEPGAEADFLAPLPLHRLSPEAGTADTLDRWGIESIGDFARLPRSEVRSRLGEVGHRLHLVARGVDPRPLVARPPAHAMREGLSLEWPIANLEPFLFVARAALERLCERLERRGLGCRRLEMSLQLEPEGFHERSIDLPAPTREAQTLLTLVRLDLEAHTPGAPILRFQFTAHPDAPRLAQMSLFGPASLSPDRLATTIARLFALLGPRRVGSPRPAAGHDPERFALVEYTPPPPPKIRRRVEPGRGLLAVRVLRPPVELEVRTTADAGPEGPDGWDPHARPGRATVDEVAEPDASSSTSPAGVQPADRGAARREVGGNGEGGSPGLHPLAEEYGHDGFADDGARLRHATVRASDSGVSRQSPSAGPGSFCPQAEGMERQVGLFRASHRCDLRPLEIHSGERDDLHPTAGHPPFHPPPFQAAGATGESRARERRALRIRGRVRVASGPWELEEKWWLEERTERDYWDVELSDGALYRIFRDRGTGRWYADGVYD